MSKEYKNNTTALMAKTEEGYIVQIGLNNLLRGSMPRAFSLEFNKGNFVYNINQFISNNNLDCSFIRVCGYDGHGHYILEMKCGCGKIFAVPQADFLKLRKFRCNCCTRKVSNLEYKTMDWLKENQVMFVPQMRFKKCKGKRCLPFDFYLPEQNICIEVDGQQHYDSHSIYSNVNLKEYDEIKNNFCEQNGIKLLRIPFWYFYNDKYKNFLSNNIR